MSAAQSRKPAQRPRAETYGTLVELTAFLDLAASALPARSRFRPWLARIQVDVLDLAAGLADDGEPARPLEPGRLEWLDLARADARGSLAPLDPFVLLRRSEVSVRLARARTASRRAARLAAALSAREPLDPLAVAYLERLAELLPLLARAADVDTGERPRPWLPDRSPACGPAAS